MDCGLDLSERARDTPMSMKLNNKKTSSFLTTTTAFKEKTNWLTNKTTSNSIKIKNKPTSNIEAINDSSFLKNLGQSYTNKALATDFYKNSNVKIRESLQHVPVFIVLNSKNEIVLAKKRILMAADAFRIHYYIYPSPPPLKSSSDKAFFGVFLH